MVRVFFTRFSAHMFMSRALPEHVIYIFAHTLVTKRARGVLLPCLGFFVRVSIVNALLHITLRKAPLSSAVKLVFVLNACGTTRLIVMSLLRVHPSLFFLATNLAPQMIHCLE